MISEKFKEKYFVEEVSLTEDLSGWKVLGMTKSVGRNFEFKTTLEGWLDEFRIRYQHISYDLGMILVDPDCSDLYILNSEDIKELVEEYISENPFTAEDFINDGYFKITDGKTTITSSPNDYNSNWWVSTSSSPSWTVSTSYSPTWVYNNDTTIATYSGAIATNTATNYIATDYLTTSAVGANVYNNAIKSKALC